MFPAFINELSEMFGGGPKTCPKLGLTEFGAQIMALPIVCTENSLCIVHASQACWQYQISRNDT